MEMDEDSQGGSKPSTKGMSDDDLLKHLKRERARAIGLDNGDELSEERTKALEYYQGTMSDITTLPNRSQAVSSDVADAVETILPDLLEIFTGGDDVAVFAPVGQEDEDAAKQETDYVNHVVFKENNGFMLLYEMFKDALIEKTGVALSWWEETTEDTEEHFTGKSQDELAFVIEKAKAGEFELVSAEPGPMMAPGVPTYNFTIKRSKTYGCVKSKAIAPEDFAVASDTIRLPEATYCAMRSVKRAQDLIAAGVSRDIVDSLPHHTAGDQDEEDSARDTVGESESGGDGEGDLRSVETITHFIRIDADQDGKPEILKVVTGHGETVLISKEQVSRVFFSALTPYPTAHRFYGLSLADLLLEVQKIKTALYRMLLDSGYFALNQRLEVAMDAANGFTIPDLLRNEPGMPIRSKTGGAVRPVQSGSIAFDPYKAIEFFSTVAEQRTGVVRNAQGLNPDTLHDTAKGAMALMAAAQKRVRMIARIFAETGVKDLFLNVHALIRENATQPSIARLRNKWVPVDPTKWGSRKDMVIEVGLGAAGRDHDIASMAQVMAVTEKLALQQGGLNGPLVTAKNVHAVVTSFYEKLGLKAPERFVSDPGDGPQPEKPDPKAAAAQQQTQIQAAKAQADAQLKQQQAQVQAQLDIEEMNRRFELQRAQMQEEFRLREQEMAAEFELRRREAILNARVKVETSTSINGPHMGGDPGR